jgi:hypothetical protein
MHYLKFHRGNDEEMTWKLKAPEDPVTEMELKKMPWWNALDASLNLG